LLIETLKEDSNRRLKTYWYNQI